jgi:hypothetical protein
MRRLVPFTRTIRAPSAIAFATTRLETLSASATALGLSAKIARGVCGVLIMLYCDSDQAEKQLALSRAKFVPVWDDVSAIAIGEFRFNIKHMRKKKRAHEAPANLLPVQSVT